jgi:hypothetical protein
VVEGFKTISAYEGLVRNPQQFKSHFKVEKINAVEAYTDGGKVVGLTHRPRFSPQKHFFCFWYSFLLEAE